MSNIFYDNQNKDKASQYVSLITANDQDSIFYYESENAIASIMSFPLLSSLSLQMQSALVTALNLDFPAGTIIQFINFGANDIDKSLQDYINARNFSKGDKSVKSAKHAIIKRAKMLRKGTTEKLIASSETRITQSFGFITLKIPLKCQFPFSESNQNKFQNECNEFIEIRNKFKDQLKIAGIEIKLLQTADAISIIRKYFNANEYWDNNIDNNILNQQLFPPGSRISWNKINQDVLHFSGFSHKRENQYACMLVVDKYPGGDSFHHLNNMIKMLGNPSGANPQISMPYALTTIIHFPDQFKKETKLRSSQAITERQSTAQMLKWSPRLRKKRDGFEVMSKAISEGNNIVEVTTTLCLFNKSFNKIKKTLNSLSSYYKNLGFIMRKERYIPAVSFFNAMPMNASVSSIENTHRFKTMTTSHCLHLLPILDEWQGFGNEILLTTRLGRLFKYSLFHPNNKNYNWITLAQSGSGKSFFIQRYTQDLLSLGAKIWTIDTGGSYLATGQIVEAQIIDFHEESNICLNPFTNITNIENEVELILPILAKMAVPNGNLSDVQRALAEEACISVFTSKGNKAQITDIIQYLNNQTGDLGFECRQLALLLSAFGSTGSMGRWFKGQYNLQTRANWTILELSKLTTNKHLCDVVLMSISINIAQQMFISKNNQKKVLVIEEGGDRITDPSFAKFIASLYSKVRKENGSVGVVIQNYNQLFTTEYGKIILASVATQFILQQTSVSIEDAIKNQWLNITDYEKSLLESIHTVKGQYSEIFIKCEHGSTIARLIETPYNKVMFSTEGDFFKELQNKIRVGQQVQDIIQQEANRIYDGEKYE